MKNVNTNNGFGQELDLSLQNNNFKGVSHMVYNNLRETATNTVNEMAKGIDLSGCVKTSRGLSVKTERRIKKVCGFTYVVGVYALAIYGLVQLFS